MVDAHPSVVSRTLFHLFRDFSARSFLFIEPGGNSGDSLIYRGAYKLAAMARLQYTAATHEEIFERIGSLPSDRVIYIHGSGGFVPLWSGRPGAAFKRLITTFKGTVILGPSTFFEDVGYLKKSFIDALPGARCERVFIFAREHTSYLLLKRCLPSGVELLEDHDTALNLEAGDLDTSRLEQKYSFYALRTDREGCPARTTNVFSRQLDPVPYSRSFAEWFLFHAKAKEIVTNRLHSSILGVVLGKRTTLMPNSYHKNRSVWEYSLASRGVTWRERLPVNRFNGWISNRDLIRRLRFSHTAQRLVRLSLLGPC